MLDLDQLVEQARTIAPLPQSLGRLADVLASDESDVDDVVEVVRFDPGLTARLLRAANAGAASPRARIATAKEAVVRLGRGSVLAVAMADAARSNLQTPLPELDMPGMALWEHAVRTAILAEVIAARTKRTVSGLAFTAALLHDIGKVVLAGALDADSLEVLVMARKDGGLSLLEAEREVFEVDHAELGALIAQHWDLPEVLIRAIQYHHEPEAMGDPTVAVVCLADHGSHMACEERSPREATRVAMETLHLSEDDLEICIERAQRFYRQLAPRFSAS